MATTLLKLKNNVSAKVIAIEGGRGFIDKLERLGIREGSAIVKISHASGPVVIKTKGVHLAVGRGMAEKIMVQEE